MTSLSSKAVNAVKRVLSDRSFTSEQIQRVIPRLHPGLIKEPRLLAETIDAWNSCMRAGTISDDLSAVKDSIPAVATPPKDSAVARLKINMNTILAEVEPDLLMLDPRKLIQRRNAIDGIGIVTNTDEHWIVLFNAPRGFYLQSWYDLTRKIYYIDSKVVDLLYDKKEQREMQRHPLVTSTAVVEADLSHIRTRYLFAKRTGYRELSYLQKVQTANTRPTLRDLILVGDSVFLDKFAPFCSIEEYSSFANLIKNHEQDEEDVDVVNQLAELETLKYRKISATKQDHLT